jgi:site-specific recombinase XerD
MYRFTEKEIDSFLAYLEGEERAEATITKYGRDLRVFALWLGKAELTKERLVSYKNHLKERYAATSVNSMLAALNGFFRFQGWLLAVKPLRIQHRFFTTPDQQLTGAEYGRLLAAAESKGRLSLVLMTLVSTGIRISELEQITAEVAGQATGQAEITNKGKTRTIFLSPRLRSALLDYVQMRGLKTGPIFVTRTGRPLDNSNLRKEMKELCGQANVPTEKAHPRNLRRLFARVFYAAEKDLAYLADILGHNDINTTRIYTATSAEEHRKRLENLDFTS